MNRFRKVTAFIAAMMATVITQAQNTTAAESGDLMHRDGRIYVVVAVVLTILIGLFIYVYSLDRKITKLEQNK